MLDSTVIEVRQHLCCANVFLKFKQPLTDSESLRLNVDETKVQFRNQKYSAEISVDKFFLILAGSFSNLIVDANNASFRITIKDIQISKKEEDNNRILVQLNLVEQDEVAVVCSNCSSTLATKQKYNKIREFPSGGIDVTEFFCHHGPNFKDILVPSLKDIFYGFQFIVVNRDVIEKSTREKENHLYCKRCLRYLGETMFNGRAAKLWSDSTRFALNGQILEIFVSDTKSEIHKLMLKAIDETSLPSSEPLLRNIHFTKVLLIATFPNRLEQYLLVHILEKHLPILRNIEVFENEMSTSEEFQNRSLELKLNKAFKILYRLIAKNEMDTTKLPPLLEYWRQDIKILKMKISPFLFSALSEELNRNIHLLPEIYRVNDDDFLLSYIFY